MIGGKYVQTRSRRSFCRNIHANFGRSHVFLPGVYMISTIYEPTGRAWEYSALALNLYDGCHFGCSYCFNKKTPWYHHDKFNRAEPRTDGHGENILGFIEKKAAKMVGDPREILLCFTCDPYPGAPKDHLTREALLILEKYKLRVQVLTKAGPASERDFDILARNKWRYGITISGGPATSAQYESFAAPVWDRIASMNMAHYAGISTFCSFEPVIDTVFCLGLMETPTFRQNCDEMRIGKTNHDKELEATVDWHKFLFDARLAVKGYSKSVIIKKDLLAYGTLTEQSQATVSSGDL